MNSRREWPAGVSFIKTELETGLTFCSIASTSTDAEKTARNTANARKAYDTALHLVDQLILTPQERQEIVAGFAALKRELLKLGEEIA